MMRSWAIDITKSWNLTGPAHGRCAAWPRSNPGWLGPEISLEHFALPDLYRVEPLCLEQVSLYSKSTIDWSVSAVFPCPNPN